MTDVKDLSALFVHRLRRLYDAEQRLTKALQQFEKAASSSELRAAFVAHLEETETHVERLDQVFGLFTEKPDARTCESIKGIIKDAEDTLDIDADPAVKDAGLIAAAQTAEHFEIAEYGTLRTWAVILVKKEAMQLLEFTLEEEKEADRKLTAIASKLNVQAATVHSD